MTFCIGKLGASGVNMIYVRSLARDGEIKDNEIVMEGRRPIFIKTYKSEKTANKDLEKMRERGHDDYSVIPAPAGAR